MKEESGFSSGSSFRSVPLRQSSDNRINNRSKEQGAGGCQILVSSSSSSSPSSWWKNRKQREMERESGLERYSAAGREREREGIDASRYLPQTPFSCAPYVT